MPDLFGCTRCSRHKTRDLIVYPEIHYKGKRPNILILGESPGEEENKTGKPFFGRSGAVLRVVLNQYFKNYIIDNTVRCWSNSKPNSKQIDACKRNWRRTVLKHNPKIIMALGAYAAQAILGKKPDMKDIVAQGIKVKLGPMNTEYPVVFNYHPAYILRIQGRKGGANEKAINAWYDGWDKAQSLLNEKMVEAPDTTLLTDNNDIFRFLASLHKKDIFAYDYETDGQPSALRPELCDKFKILSAGVGCDEGGFAFPFVPEIYAQWQRLLKSGNTIAHYSKYEHKCNIKIFGETWRCEDTAMGMNVMNELSSAKLGSVGHFYHIPWSGYKIEMRDIAENAAKVPLDKLLRYNSLDALLTYQIWRKMRHDLVPLHEVYNQRRLFSMHLAGVEMDGLYVNKSILGTVRKETKKQITVAMNDLRRHKEVIRTETWAEENIKTFKPGDVYNPKSPKQTDYLCAKQLKLKPVSDVKLFGHKSDKKTGWDKNVLEVFKKNTVVSDLLRVRSLSSMMSGFLSKWEKYTGPDGCCHSMFNQDVTVTGRLSSTVPNLQNIPGTSLVKKVFTSRFGEDGVLLVFDYKQLEPRLLAGWSGDVLMCKALNEGMDLHRFVAGQIFGVDYENVTDEQRSIGKRRNLGSMYGQTAAGLAQASNISLEKAQEIVDIYNRRFVGAYNWRMEKHAEAVKFLEVKDLFGAIRHLKDARHANKSKANRALRQASNFPIQSTGNSFCLIGLCRTRDRLAIIDYPALVVSTVHDSIIVDTYKIHMIPVIRNVVECLLSHNNDWYWKDKPVKMEVDIKFGPNLLQLKPFDMKELDK